MTTLDPVAYVERSAAKLYLVVDEVPWRVHDCDYRDFRTIRRPLGAPDARSRYFVAQDGTQRMYKFKKQDDHSLELATLARQLSSAGWVARERFEPGKVRPT